MKRLMLLALPLVFILGVTPPQLHAADWTEFKVTRASIQQLDGLKFAGKVEGSPLSPETEAFSHSASLSISDEAQNFRFAGQIWAGRRKRSFDIDRPLRMKGGKLRVPFMKGARLFTVERNSVGKFRISTEFESPGRQVSTITLVLTQE